MTTPQTPAAPKSSVMAPGTYAGAGALIGLTAIYWLLSAQMSAGVLGGAAYTISYWLGTLLHVLFAIVIIGLALRIGLDQGVGKQWLLVGLGVAVYAIGDIIWTVLDLHLGLKPYPSLADPLYLLQYVFFMAAVVLAIRSYGHLTPVRTPIIIATVVALVLGIVAYVALLAPYIFPAGVAELGFWGLVLSAFYPVGDVVFILAPALALALVIRQLGAGRLGWPWWIIVVGAVIYSLTDAFYSYADWSGLGVTVALDMGWVFANLAFALAALVARDVYRVR